MRRSLFTRLLASNLAIVILSLLLLSSMLSVLVSRHILASQERELVAKGQEIARITALHLQGQLAEETAMEILTALDQFLDARIWVVSHRGLIILESRGERPGMHRFFRGTHVNPDTMARVLAGEVVTDRGTLPQFPGLSLQTATIPVTVDSTVIGALMILSPVTGLQATMAQIHRLIALSALAAAALATGASYLSSRSLSHPLERVERAARTMARGDFSIRLPEQGGREIASLSRTFNDLSGSLKQTLEALERQKSRFVDMVTSMSDGVISADQGGVLDIINPAARTMLGLSGEAVGQEFSEALPGPLACAFAHTLENPGPRTFTLPGDESSQVLAVYLSPITALGDGSGGVVALLQDVSERHRLESMRRQFVANVSHDLRTPLTSIRGFIEPLLDGTVSSEKDRRRYLEIIREEGLRLGRLLDDLLDLSRLESGSLELDIAPVDLPAVSRDVLDRFRLEASSREIDLVLNLGTDLPMAVGDRDRVQQVMVNLLDNALKYAGRGGTVAVEVAREDQDVVVRVRDTGPGIEEAHLDRVFDRFYKIDKSRGRSEAGSGLGLAIVRQLVEAQGGQVGVESSPGKGSTFYFTLPRAERSDSEYHDKTPSA